MLVDNKTKAGGYGTTEQMEQQDKDRRKVYTKNKLGSARAQLRIVSQSYGDMVRTFLFQVELIASFYQNMKFISCFS